MEIDKAQLAQWETAKACAVAAQAQFKDKLAQRNEELAAILSEILAPYGLEVKIGEPANPE